MKIRRVLILALALVCLCSSALAAYCTTCGSSVDSSYAYCPSCGAKQPSGGGQSNSYVPAGGFRITEVSYYGEGKMRVTWEDPSNDGPYSIHYMSWVSGDFSTDLDNTTGIWPSAKDVTGKSAVIDRIIPGQRVWIVVLDQDNDYCYYDYTPLPSSPFPEFGTDVHVTLKTRVGNNYKEVPSFSSSDISRNRSSKSYGAYIKLTYPQLARAREYDCLVTITGPNGETIIDTVTTMELDSGRSYTYWNFFSFDWYFNILTEYYGVVPVGDYTWTMYYDGMFVNSHTFFVDY